jgi:hypothetical protein
MYLRINRFGGIQPLVDTEKLPDHRAQTATAPRFESGNLRTYATGAQVATVPQPAVFTQDARSVYYVAPNKFLVWQGAVTAVRGPMPAAAGSGDFRIVFSGDTGATPVWPRWTTRDRGCPSATWRDAPSAGGVYPLGVPKPADVPLLETSAPPVGTITAATNTNPIALTITGGAALETGHRIKIGGAPESGNGSELNGASFTITKDTDSLIRLSAADGSGWTAALTGLAWTWQREFSDVDNEQRAYCYTLVRVIDGLEEEGPPSTPSAVTPIPPGATVEVSTSTAASRPYTGIDGLSTVIAKKRIYRSVAGTQAALFQFVAERDINEGAFTDDKEFSELGEVLPTEDFDLPPQNLVVLAELPNGVLVGAFDNVLCASEPYQPSFWPTKYRRTMNNPIVGAAVYGSTIVVATTANPVVVFGIDPASWSDEQLDQVYPALDRTAVCSSGSSVFFVSTVGIVQVDNSGARVITAAYWTAEQWKALMGTNVTTGFRHAAWWSNRLVVRYGAAASLIVTFIGNGEIEVCTLSTGFNASATAVDRTTESLYFMQAGAGPGNRMLYQFDPPTGSTPITYTWRSKSFHLPREANFSAMQVFAKAYHGGSNVLTVNVYADGVLRRTVNVANQNPLRLPAGFLARNWQVEVVANVEVQAIHVADNLRELRELAL